MGAGETARFAVVVDGKPLPDIMWYKVRGWLRPPSEHGWRWGEWRGDFLRGVQGVREAWTERRRKWDPEALVTLGNKGGTRPLGELALGPEGKVRLGSQAWAGVTATSAGRGAADREQPCELRVRGERVLPGGAQRGSPGWRCLHLHGP